MHELIQARIDAICRYAVFAATALFCAHPATAADAPPISVQEIDGHLRFLASDLLEGRAPGTRGGQLTEEYLATQLQTFGLEPAGEDGTWFQRVPMDMVTAVRESIQVSVSGRSNVPLRHPDDIVVWAGAPVAQSAAQGEIVFVGYGISAPEHRWDDFKGVDLTGKVALVLVNDPPATKEEPGLFGGRAMTYYGRWTYKLEEAERRGAAGVILVHNQERAGYPWHTVVGSWDRDNPLEPRDGRAHPPAVQAWMRDEVAASMLKEARLELDTLVKVAGSRAFQPVATGILFDASLRNTVQRIEGRNVIGMVRGTDPKLRDQYVVLSAHWDHLGIGPEVNGDRIYNGAWDNASGVADLLAAARKAAASKRSRRSLLFVFTTGEESGLLGAKRFARNGPQAAEAMVANLNVDGGNLLGRVRDLEVIGADKSSLGASLEALIAPEGMKISPDPFPERGRYYRMDHLAFARRGVPAVSISDGNDFVGRPMGWGEAQSEAFLANHYHQPSDQYRPDLDLRGAAQLADIVLRLAMQVANAPARPTWSPASEFQRLPTDRR